MGAPEKLEDDLELECRFKAVCLGRTANQIVLIKRIQIQAVSVVEFISGILDPCADRVTVCLKRGSCIDQPIGWILTRQFW